MYIIHMQKINLIHLQEQKWLYFFFKELSSISTLIFKLNHFSFGERLLFAVVGGLIFSFYNSLDFQLAIILFARPADILKVLKIGWNTKKFCEASSLK